MFNYLEKFKIAIYCLISLFVFTLIAINKDLKSENKSLVIEISIIKEESQKELQRVHDINLKSQEKINRSQKRINELLLTKVPVDCREAITWSIKQARKFNNDDM